MDDMRKIYTDRFRAADEFTFFHCGQYQPGYCDARWLKNTSDQLLPSGRKENMDRQGCGTARRKDHKEDKRSPDNSKGNSVPLFFRSDLKYTPENYLGLEVINGILDISVC
jgi:hypothetical protein